MIQLTRLITLHAAVTLALIPFLHVVSYAEETPNNLAVLVVVLSASNPPKLNLSQDSKKTPPWSPTLKKRRLFNLPPLVIPSYNSEKQSPPWSPTLESPLTKQAPPWSPTLESPLTKQAPPWSPTLESPLTKQAPPWGPTLESPLTKQAPPWGPLKAH